MACTTYIHHTSLLQHYSKRKSTHLHGTIGLGTHIFKFYKHIIRCFSLPTSQIPQKQLYDICCLSKAHKFPFTRSIQKILKHLELVHLDLWGPTQISSHFDFNYYIICIDIFNKYSWHFPLKKEK